MDGFFVAKFQKIGPTPANAVRANGNAEKGVQSFAASETEVIDKTPITEDKEDEEKKDEFGGFDEEQDQDYILRAKRNAMRRRGLDPRALNYKGGKKEKEDKKEGEGEKQEKATKEAEKETEKRQVKPQKKQEEIEKVKEAKKEKGTKKEKKAGKK